MTTRRPGFRVLLRVAALLALLTAGAASAATYRFDTAHSQILASANHNGFSQPVGRLAIADGWLRFDPDHWSTAATELDIDLASVDFGDPDWNRALRGANWLDTANARYAHFKSTSVERGDDDTGVVHGKLTLRGVTRAVDIHVRLNRAAFTIFDMRHVAGFSASARFLRSDFGLRSNLASVGNAVTLRLEIEAIRDDNAVRDYRRRHPDDDPDR